MAYPTETGTASEWLSRIDAATIRDLLDYDQLTGVFRWKNPRSPRVHRGDVAGSLRADGYYKIQILGRECLAHRAAWLWFYGEWPRGELDHINRDPMDNRIANLREATRSQNMGNTRRSLNNSTGFKGVSRDVYGFRARIKVGDKTVYLGCFATPEAAHQAYSDAATKHRNEFARVA